MIEIIEHNKQRIVGLCKEHGIRRLELFGSATTGAYDPEHSDLDFIADVGTYEAGVGMRFLRFCTALETILGRPVDVITPRQIRNPYFRTTVDATRVTVYHQ